VRFPQPDDFRTALAVKNLRRRPPLRPLAVAVKALDVVSDCE
jgi:hypothetical protein